MPDDNINRLEALAQAVTKFALDDVEKANSLLSVQAAVWVMLGRGRSLQDVLADPECGLIVGTTRPLDDLFGYAEGKLIGENIKILIPKRFHDHHDQYFAAFSLDPSRKLMGGARPELPGQHKQGHEMLLEIALDPKFIRGRQVAVGTVARSRKNANEGD